MVRSYYSVSENIFITFFQIYKSLVDKAGMGSLVSVRYLGEEKCVFLSKDLLTPIQVTLTGIVKMNLFTWYLRCIRVM